MVSTWMMHSGIDCDSIILVVGGKHLCKESLDHLRKESFADVLVLRGSDDNATVAVMDDAGLKRKSLAWEVERWSTAHMTAAIEDARLAIKEPACDVVQKSLEDELYVTGENVCLRDEVVALTTDGYPSAFQRESVNGENLRRARAVVLACSKELAPKQVALAKVLSKHFASAEINTADLETFATSAEKNANNTFADEPFVLSAEKMDELVTSAETTDETFVSSADTYASEDGRVEHEVVTPNELIERLPLSAKAAFTVQKAREEIGRILDRTDDRVIAITGPCSIHDPRAALEYAEKLKKFADEHRNELVVVMRTYFEKPRTTVGWKGLLTDPDLNGACDLNKGLHLCRNVLMRINELGLPCAVEMLSNVAPPYFFDLVSWAAVGARTTESQIHREMVSGMDRLPVGFKNGTQGNTDIAVDAMECAGASHSYLTLGADGRACVAVSSGNKQCHVILRGGKHGPNFSSEHVAACEDATRKKNMHKRLIVDCSHGNSNKNHANQPKVVADISTQLTNGSQAIGGVMIESNLVEGAQKLDPGKTILKNLTYGQSVTDACVNMEVTNEMFVTLANGVKRRRLH